MFTHVRKKCKETHCNRLGPTDLVTCSSGRLTRASSYCHSWQSPGGSQDVSVNTHNAHSLGPSTSGNLTDTGSRHSCEGMQCRFKSPEWPLNA